MRKPNSLGAGLFFVLLAASLIVAVLTVRARTPDLVLEVTGWTPCSRELSPALDGDRGRVRVTFFVREAEQAARITIVDAGEETVRTLDSALPLDAREEVSFTWDGRTDGGETAPPGLYRLGVELPSEDREMIWPRRIGLDVAQEADELCEDPN